MPPGTLAVPHVSEADKTQDISSSQRTELWQAG